MSSGSPTDATPIRILHLSDFHLREKTRWDSDPVLDGLAETIRRIVAEGPKPGVVAITGDIAFSGKAAEYEVARRWITTRGCFRRLPHASRAKTS
jgi:3',5'-cyclic AMP phosphodiesterase CpdA